MIKSIYTFILCVAIIASLGFILIKYDDDKFRELCKNEPTIPQCPKLDQGKAL